MALTQITSDGLSTNAVTADKIATGAVTVADIPDGEITTAKLSSSLQSTINGKADTTTVNTALATKAKITSSSTAPIGASAGDLWYDTVNNVMKHYTGSAWLEMSKMSNKFSATGGTISTFGAYKLHAFTTSGTFVVEAAGEIEYLIVAGGGGSDGYHAGGGGAGGLIEGTVSLSPGNYSIVIGAGGTTGDTGTPGNNSSAFNVSAIRGGNGLRQGATADADNDGGSGGGSSDGNNRSGTATTGQGYAGGYKNGHGTVNSGSNLNYPTCGGGGAGGAGGDDTSTSGGYGGVGKNLSAKYGTAYGQSGWFAGGGGGTSLSTLNGSATPALYGIGGQGGGGTGGYTNTAGGVPVRNSASGSANTGGGGGGYLYSNNGGGNGGSGIVIIRYPI